MADEQILAADVETALGVELRSLLVIYDLSERLAQITDAQIAASNRRLKPAPHGIKIIGRITDTSTRALYALWMSLQSEAGLEKAKSRLVSNAQSETDHAERHARLDTLAEVARELWWAQVKFDLAINRHVSIGIFLDWLIAERPDAVDGGIAGILGMVRRGGGDDDE